MLRCSVGRPASYRSGYHRGSATKLSEWPERYMVLCFRTHSPARPGGRASPCPSHPVPPLSLPAWLADAKLPLPRRAMQARTTIDPLGIYEKLPWWPVCGGWEEVVWRVALRRGCVRAQRAWLGETHAERGKRTSAPS
jgi:hypothetical protein